MKRKILGIFVSCILVFNVGANSILANTEKIEGKASLVEVEVIRNDAINSNETYYGMQKLLKKVRLYDTFSLDARADLLTEFAQERLTDVQEIDKQGKYELAEDLLKKYVANILEAQSNIEKAGIKKETVKDILNKMEILLTVNLEILEDIQVYIPEIQRNIDILIENIAVIKATSEVIEKAEVIIDDKALVEEIKAKKDQSKNYGVGEIRLMNIIAKKAGISLEEVIELKETGLSWGNLAKELGISLGMVANELNYFIIEEVKEEAKIEKREQTEEKQKTTTSELIQKLRPGNTEGISEDRTLERAREIIDKNNVPGGLPAFVEEILKARGS